MGGPCRADEAISRTLRLAVERACVLYTLPTAGRALPAGPHREPPRPCASPSSGLRAQRTPITVSVADGVCECFAAVGDFWALEPWVTAGSTKWGFSRT